MSEELKGTFDRYTIEGVIGEGGMGRVYRAYDPKLRRRVALKVLRTDTPLFEGDEAARRLLREARAAAMLNHPNVVSIFDVGESEGQPFVVMELVDGAPLSAVLEDATVPLERKLKWLTDIARALAVAHDHGLVHRDVKPSNVLVTADDTIKVLDFGLARPIALPQTPGIEEITQPGQLMGTPRYMAPEQISGGPIDGRADQFAWGVLAYRVLVGDSPWKTESMPVLAAILTQEVEPFADRVPGLSHEVQAIILRALSKGPLERFQSTHDLVARMQRATSTESGSQRRVEEVYDEPLPSTKRPSKLDERARRRIVLAAAGIALVGFAFAHWSSTKPRASAPTASASASSVTSTPVTMTDQPPPETSSPEARAAFRQGMQSMRDGDMSGALDAWGRACAADPGLAAAHLRLGIELLYDAPTDARSHFRAALQQRSALGAHDQALLDAATPHVLDDVSDEDAWEKRLAAATDRFPNDAELAMYLVRARVGHGTLAERLAIVDRGLALDPKFGLLFAVKGELLSYAGDLEGARRATRTCLEAVPSSTHCLAEQTSIDSELGDCAAYTADTRRLAASSGSSRLQRELAGVLWLEGRPLSAVRAALDRGTSALPDKRRPIAQKEDDLILDVVTGDFAAAELAAREYQRLVASSDIRGDQAHAAQMVIEIERELGDDAAAARVASDYLARKDAWVLDPRREDFAIAHDPTPWMASIVAKTGGMTRERFVAMRDEWVRDWSARVLPAYRNFVWAHGYEATVETDADAREAIAALPRFGELPTYGPRTNVNLDAGRMYVLARDAEHAVPALERAAHACAQLDVPLQHTQAHLWLGRALELRGDHAGACEAYGVVETRWGHAARSVTTRAAKERLRALRCAER